MAMLLSDVGGTNARLALAREGVIDPHSIRRFRGDDFARYEDVVAAYLDELGRPAITAACVAVAGPVAAGRARLTNRDWLFAERDLMRLTGAGQARLINDLTALGYATARLGPQGLDTLRMGTQDRPRNGQSLVAGFGTGFNVCAVRRLSGGRITCLESEEGHTSLPAAIMARLYDLLGQQAAAFTSTEETFAGRGLSRLHHALSGEMLRAEDVTAAARDQEAKALRTLDLFAELSGMLLRELTLRFMPREGVYLAGSVARALLDWAGAFERGLAAAPFMAEIVQSIPVYLIRDDLAALEGCLAAIE